jgi:opacity protein-like surface antigen
MTATVDYAMWANVLSRLELRWDHFGNKNADALNSALVKTDSLGFYANLIYKF